MGNAMGVYGAAQLFISLEKIEAFLVAEDETPEPVQLGSTNRLSAASFTWEGKVKDRKGPFQFDSLNLEFPTSFLTVLVGPVASGKSSLLHAIAGEMRKTSGKITLVGKRAYCPQTPWIQNASARENIIFGSEFDQVWYDQVVHACALTSDFELFQSGDQTEIGEMGINLSGGQKARINLARAIYCQADLTLLDDVSVSLKLRVSDLSY